MWKSLYSLFKKDCRITASGKFFLVTLGSLLLYTLFIHFGYLNFMADNTDTCRVYLYDPAETLGQVSPLIHSVASMEELDEALARDTSGGVGICITDNEPNVVLYAGTEKFDRCRTDYALSLLHPGSEYIPETVGDNSPEMKQRKEITCELLFIEVVAIGFLGIASVLFKEKQMGVIRVHAVMPFPKNLFIFSKIFLFLLTDLIFAALITLFNVGPAEAGSILPAILIQTVILSLIMILTGFGCAMLLKDFKQFSLLYLVISLFTTVPVFLSANPAIKTDWILYHPFFHVYTKLKNAFFGIPVTSPVYYICATCIIFLLFGITTAAFRKEMGKEG
ncbi:MAG: ABC transporter permease [Lachnospiraceae bacterium]|nr:ABC transporter permease [Lachnospiraceae bacterium]